MYEKILVPVDGSETSNKALDEAVRMARLSGGRIRLLHVVGPMIQVSGYDLPVTYLNEVQEALMRAGEDVITEAKDRVADASLLFDTKVVESSITRVSEVIVDHAQSWGADLIVIGTHGRRGVKRMVLGSDAEQVVRMSPVPVLLVRHSG